MTTSARPTVLILIDHYLPGTRSGGPVRTISNLVETLGDEFDFRIVALDRDFGDTSSYPNICYGLWHPVGKGHVLYLRPNEQRLWTLRKVLRSIRTNLVLLNGIYPQITLSFLTLKRLGMAGKVEVLIAPRGHLESGALSIKPLKKRVFLTVSKWIGLFDSCSWLAASESEKYDVLREFGSNRIGLVRAIPNLAVLSTLSTTDENKSESQKIPGLLRLVFLSRISRKKNLTYALDVLRRVSGRVSFDIFGPLEDENYWHECQGIISTLPQGIDVRHKGELNPDAVTETLRNYHMFVLPTLGENFGHAILESLCAGCPVLISDRTPWNDITDRGAGWALPLDEPERFRAAIQQIVDADDTTWRGFSERASAYAADYLANSSAVEDMRRFLTDLAAESSRERQRADSDTAFRPAQR